MPPILDRAHAAGSPLLATVPARCVASTQNRLELRAFSSTLTHSHLKVRTERCPRRLHIYPSPLWVFDFF